VGKRNSTRLILTFCLIAFFSYGTVAAKDQPALRRPIPEKTTLTNLPANVETDVIVVKLVEGMGQPEFDGRRFDRAGAQWDRLNQAVATTAKTPALQPRFQVDKETLNQMRDAGSLRIGQTLPDLTLYHELRLPAGLSASEKLARLNELNSLDIVEIAYFAPNPSPAAFMNPPRFSAVEVQLSPNWESAQYYLQAAPTGIDAYYAWDYTGGKGEGVKVIDIEGNWVQTHEDLHGGTDNFHIAGSRINDPGWYNHGTAVLGEIAADSNSIGMTGIAFNCNLGTVSIGSMSTAAALSTAIANSDTGDVFLIELHAPGPHYDFENREDQAGYVPMEYWQENFDVILQASALGRIVVEAGGNGNEDLDNASIYGSLFDPDYRFSGAIMVGASNSSHVPASFTNYGERVDVHAFGTWDVYTLGYGDLYGSSSDNHYTGTFAGTSSASPIITGACAILQGVHKAVHGRILHHDEMRSLLTTYSTPQAPAVKQIGPLPDLQGSVDQVVGVSFVADTTFGWVPFDVAFSGSSGLSVDIWTWDFGDGENAYVQSPTHTYAMAGMHTVSLEIAAGGDLRLAQKASYIIALADTLAAPAANAAAGQQVELAIRLRNNVPINSLILPFEWPGNLAVSLDSTSRVGCRTVYFEVHNRVHSDLGHQRVTEQLLTSALGTQPALPPGDGDVLKLYFTIPASASFDQTASLILDGYNSYLPSCNGSVVVYTPQTVAGLMSVCINRGDMDGVTGITVSDLTYLVNYLFDGGFPPYPPVAADVNCSDDTNVGDLTYLVDYLFRGGPAPCGC